MKITIFSLFVLNNERLVTDRHNLLFTSVEKQRYDLVRYAAQH